MSRYCKHDNKMRYRKLRYMLQQDTGDQDVDYCLTTKSLVIFRDKIYVLDNSELKKLILREFHAKAYLGHPGYQKTLKMEKKFYYWLKLKKEVAEFMARCLDCQQINA